MKGKRDLLKPGRVSRGSWSLSTVTVSGRHIVMVPLDMLCVLQMFVKEGTLMKVSKKSRQPRHLFLVIICTIQNFRI